MREYNMIKYRLHYTNKKKQIMTHFQVKSTFQRQALHKYIPGGQM